MTIPDSLQTLGRNVFLNCPKLAPSSIDFNDWNNDITPEVVAHLRSEMSLNALLSGNNFLNTDDFRRLLVPFLPGETLMTLVLATKAWNAVVDAFVDERVASGEMIVHGGNDINWEDVMARQERRKLTTRVIFPLNITMIGEHACFMAVNLIVVDILEGVESIGDGALAKCNSLITVSFPTTLKSIGHGAFGFCTCLENVDLLHANLQKLGERAFGACSELKSMTIPDSLQAFGRHVFFRCSKLVTSSIDVNNYDGNKTPKVIAHLRSKQSNP
ncbi:hypothetical protein TL16_g01107 [Triparma laevis f. inornata]|uniref:Uncharacterized protein n=1 Tax=Triparma laevis f. inornata TaxID=1714386 RepID=A0A9W6ZJW1_9STRA|nr:hypothetical protein TL16_g01107 [Triparma laevis f. inornata]